MGNNTIRKALNKTAYKHVHVSKRNGIVKLWQNTLDETTWFYFSERKTQEIIQLVEQSKNEIEDEQGPIYGLIEALGYLESKMGNRQLLENQFKGI